MDSNFADINDGVRELLILSFALAPPVTHRHI